MKKVIIQGSSRSKGNTNTVVNYLKDKVEIDHIDLLDYSIHHFDYDLNKSSDDFNSLFEYIIKEYDVIILATPIYWFSMSSIMKVFVERISGFLKSRKFLCLRLRNKYVGVISCGSEDSPIEGFFIPFRKSAEYLKVNYIGELHVGVENDLSKVSKSKITDFSRILIDL